MPISRRTLEQRNKLSSSSTPDPEGLRPYTFHGIDLTITDHGRQGVGDCPFCSYANKFSVEVETTKFKCWSCNVSGNNIEFIRLLYELSVNTTPNDFYDTILNDRSLCEQSTLTDWGICRSAILTSSWLVPGYSVEGKLTQLYRRTNVKNSNDEWVPRLLPTPGLWPDGKVHSIHMITKELDLSRPRVDIMEGIWDALAYWEVLQTTNGKDDTNVIAVPGCNVWRDEWTLLCKGKDVTIWFDSDHPRVINNQKFQAGYEGIKRVAGKLSGYASSISYLKWGEEGYDPSKPDGWDVRDVLCSAGRDITSRHEALCDLVTKISDIPSEWGVVQPKVGANGTVHVPSIEPISCDSWKDCEEAWKHALEWRDELSYVMVTMLGVAASTNQSGDNQLFLRVIGDPGSAKTRLCKGLLVSKHCKLLLHLKSFHSGYKSFKPGEENLDFSLVSRISGMCLITPEADALTLGKNSEEIDSQVRQIFDGESGNTYGNESDERHYKGLRSPWIQAGTPALMDKDQSRLGDRFLRVRIEQPDEDTKRTILRRALRNERMAVCQSSNGTESSIIPPKLRKAYAITGGYVNWLRTNIDEKISVIEKNMSDYAEDLCIDLGMFTAEMRARPNMDGKKLETFPSKELPTRLVSQLGRLALCVAAVLNKTTVDNEVMKVIKKVALDTSYGHTLNIVTWLCSRNPKSHIEPNPTYQESGGVSERTLAVWCNMTPDRMLAYLMFLRKIGVVEVTQVRQVTHWTLTDRMYKLYLRIMKGR